jgi:hypothetical protein
MTALLVILILLLIFAVPTWPYSSSWGYTPVGIIVVIIIIFLIFGGGFNL